MKVGGYCDIALRGLESNFEMFEFQPRTSPPTSANHSIGFARMMRWAGSCWTQFAKTCLYTAGDWTSFSARQKGRWKKPLRSQNDLVKCRHRMRVRVSVVDVE